MSPAPRRGFALGLSAIAAAAFVLRLVYALLLDPPSGDAAFYHRLANGLADGGGFSNPLLGGPTAAHPPLFSAVLALPSVVGATGIRAHQAVGCLLGTGTVVVAGIVGRRLGGARAGLAAAGVGAVYLPLIANDSLLFSESLYGLTIALVLLAALRTLEDPTAKRAALLGAAIGLAALTRAEALVLVVLLGLPLALGRPRGARAALAMLLAAACVVVPWTARNWIAFDRPVLISTNDGSVVAGANCPSTYGRLLGQWDIRCSIRAGIDPLRPGDRKRALAEARALEQAPGQGGLARPRNEAEVSRRQFSAGIRYASDHLGRIPVVLVARVGRTWSVYRPGEQVRTNAFLRGTPRWLEWLTVASFFFVAALALAGAARVRSRGLELLVLASPVALVTLTALLGYGTPRFRHAAEVSLVILAGVALAALSTRMAGRGEAR